MRLIDADAAIQAVSNVTVLDKSAARRILTQLPTIETIPVKKGKWIEVYDPYNRIRGKCSVCGWEAHLYEDDVVGMPYCPNCGTPLEGVEE